MLRAALDVCRNSYVTLFCVTSCQSICRPHWRRRYDKLLMKGLALHTAELVVCYVVVVVGLNEFVGLIGRCGRIVRSGRALSSVVNAPSRSLSLCCCSCPPSNYVTPSVCVQSWENRSSATYRRLHHIRLKAELTTVLYIYIYSLKPAVTALDSVSSVCLCVVDSFACLKLCSDECVLL